MKIMTILGARPQFIKAAAISREFSRKNLELDQKIEEIIVHTGQHFDQNMSEVFFEQLQIPKPKYNLGISGLAHGAMTGQMLESVEVLLKKESPDWVLVYGDTNSTLAGALAAAKLHIPIAHVEAGLRSHHYEMPEEINRILTDRVSEILFCPTLQATKNLIFEGFPYKCNKGRMQTVENVGDVMLDITLHFKGIAMEGVDLKTWGVTPKQYVICTLHRAENTDSKERLREIFSALQKISKQYEVVFPLHPRTKKILLESGNEAWLEGIKVIDPLPYLEMQRLEIDAKAILTDSGGIQKEAFFHQVPCITLREETEWVETVSLGANQLAGASFERIIDAFNKLKPVDDGDSPYGNGNAAKLIVSKLISV